MHQDPVLEVICAVRPRPGGRDDWRDAGEVGATIHVVLPSARAALLDCLERETPSARRLHEHLAQSERVDAWTLRVAGWVLACGCFYAIFQPYHVLVDAWGQPLQYVPCIGGCIGGCLDGMTECALRTASLVFGTGAACAVIGSIWIVVHPVYGGIIFALLMGCVVAACMLCCQARAPKTRVADYGEYVRDPEMARELTALTELSDEEYEDE